MSSSAPHGTRLHAGSPQAQQELPRRAGTERRVSLTLGRGEVLAVIGENGAGKSTLMKILAGVQPPDEGEIARRRPAGRDSTRSRRRHAAGIALIHQELNLADNLDVAANIFLGREPRTAGADRSTARDRPRGRASCCDRVGLDVARRARIVGTLSIGQQQMVEIAKALSINARVLIMDEPTVSLTQHETDQLFKVVDRSAMPRGISVVYISHRLGEVKNWPTG